MTDNAKDYLCHVEGWTFDMLTHRVVDCPPAFQDWKLTGYEIQSARGAGYKDNTLYAILRLACGPSTATLQVPGIPLQQPLGF